MDVDIHGTQFSLLYSEIFYKTNLEMKLWYFVTKINNKLYDEKRVTLLQYFYR